MSSNNPLLTPALKSWLCENYNLVKDADLETFKLYAKRALEDGSLKPDKFLELATEKKDSGLVPDDFSRNGSANNLPESERLTSSILAKLSGGGSIRVKAESEKYSSKRWSAKHSKTGEPVRNERGIEVENPSELDYAKTGVLLKFLAKKSGVSSISLSEHEENLLAEMAENDKWCGERNGEYLYDAPMSKALLDDVTSGGLEVTPVAFDENIVTFPLLHGELFPFVDLVEVPRGRRIEGGSISNPTVTWGTAEGTAMIPFDTSSLVAAIDTTVFNMHVAIEIGLDFMSDSPADVGRILTQNVGQRFMAELDKVIASGDGTTQPQGFANASGLTTVASENGIAGPSTIADYEGLLFSVGKQYRNSAMRPAFIANDTSYSRARGIAVSGSDQRRVFGLNEQSYSLLEYPFKVQNDLANTFVAFGALAKYRMYRRIGQAVRFEIGGKELTTKNLGLLVVRGRYGGKVVDTNAFAKTTDAQS